MGKVYRAYNMRFIPNTVFVQNIFRSNKYSVVYAQLTLEMHKYMKYNEVSIIVF
jgi:hypothetical protein